MNDAIALVLAALNLAATSIVLWVVSDHATWPMMATALAGAFMIVAFWLGVRAVRAWDWSRQ